MTRAQRSLVHRVAVPRRAVTRAVRVRTARVSRRTERATRLVLALIILSLARAQQPSKTAFVDYRYFPGLARMDGNWAALKAASDGKVYVGLACHGCDGHLLSEPGVYVPVWVFVPERLTEPWRTILYFNDEGAQS